MFADFILNDKPLNFREQHMEDCRRRIALAILKNEAPTTY